MQEEEEAEEAEQAKSSQTPRHTAKLSLAARKRAQKQARCKAAAMSRLLSSQGANVIRFAASATQSSTLLVHIMFCKAAMAPPIFVNVNVLAGGLSKDHGACNALNMCRITAVFVMSEIADDGITVCFD